MKIDCRVIEDLLPLYHDGVCSEASRKLVEEHVSECFECRMLLKKMEEKVGVEHAAPDDAGALKAIGDRVRRTGKKKVFMGALAAAAAAVAAALLWWTATDVTIVSVPTEKIAINDLSYTHDGTIAFQLLIDDGKELRQLLIEKDEETGTVYLNPRRALIEQRKYGDRYMSLNGQYVFVRTADMPGDESWIQEHFTGMMLDENVVRLCVGTESDNIVIWEEGMELPAAADYVEARYNEYDLE